MVPLAWMIEALTLQVPRASFGRIWDSLIG